MQSPVTPISAHGQHRARGDNETSPAGRESRDQFPKINNLRLEALKASISSLNVFDTGQSDAEIAGRVIGLAKSYEDYLQGR